MEWMVMSLNHLKKRISTSLLPNHSKLIQSQIHHVAKVEEEEEEERVKLFFDHRGRKKKHATWLVRVYI